MTREIEQHGMTPIFVLGQQRSGTTWVANMLAAHPKIAGVQAIEHHGIHESVFFSHFAREYGDLKQDDNLTRFLRDFTASDYFLITGLNPLWLKEQRPESYEQAFRIVMDEFARQRGADHWVEKSPHHTLLADEIKQLFPDAWFIGIVRKPDDQIISQLKLHKNARESLIRRWAIYVRKAGAWSLYARFLQRFCKSNPRCICLNYEVLKANPAREMRRIADTLGITYTEKMLSPSYRPNTSFSSSAERKLAVGNLERAICAGISYGMSVIPISILRRLEAWRREKRGIDWPDWVWKRLTRSYSKNPAS